MALSNVALFGGAFLTPVITGKITNSMGWEWTFYFVAIFAAAAFPFVFFFVPETAYKRADHLNTDIEGDKERRRLPRATGSTEQVEDESSTGVNKAYEQSKEGENLDEMNGNVEQSGSDESETTARESDEAAQREIPVKESFAKSLRIFNGRKTDEDFLKLLLRPLPLFFHPGILWVCIFPAIHSNHPELDKTDKSLGLFDSGCYYWMDGVHQRGISCSLYRPSTLVQ